MFKKDLIHLFSEKFDHLVNHATSQRSAYGKVCLLPHMDKIYPSH